MFHAATLSNLSRWSESVGGSGLNDCSIPPAKLAERRQRYEGARIRLVHMSDPHAPVAPGTEGVCTHVDDAGTLHMSWDSGRTLGLVIGADRFEVLVP